MNCKLLCKNIQNSEVVGATEAFYNYYKKTVTTKVLLPL